MCVCVSRAGFSGLSVCVSIRLGLRNPCEKSVQSDSLDVVVAAPPRGPPASSVTVSALTLRGRVRLDRETSQDDYFYDNSTKKRKCHPKLKGLDVSKPHPGTCPNSTLHPRTDVCNTARFQRKTRHRGALSGAEREHTPQAARKDRIHIEHGATTHRPASTSNLCAGTQPPPLKLQLPNTPDTKYPGERGPGERFCEAGCVLERALPDLASGAEHIARLALPRPH